MNAIINAIKSAYPINNSELELLTSSLTRHVFPRKYELIQGGTLNRNVYFIEKGITRSYCIINGNDVTTWFSLEGDITFGLLDLYRGTAGFEYVETLEECEMYSISVDTLNSLYEKSLDIANWSRVIHQECVLSLQLNRMDVLSLSAGERYEMLLKRHPDIHSRANLGHIASFLGITQSTLSKIRAKL